MVNKSPKELKRWARAHKSLAERVCLARAFAECERARVTAYTRPIFDSYRFEDEEGERIIDPEQLYLCENDELCAAYYADCDVAHKAHGFDGPDGHCPALVAEDLQRRAENELLDALGHFCGFENGNFNHTLQLRAKALDLALTCCLGTLM